LRLCASGVSAPMIGMIEPSVIAESRIRAFKVEDEKEFKDIGKRLDAELAGASRN